MIFAKIKVEKTAILNILTIGFRKLQQIVKPEKYEIEPKTLYNNKNYSNSKN